MELPQTDFVPSLQSAHAREPQGSTGHKPIFSRWRKDSHRREHVAVVGTGAIAHELLTVLDKDGSVTVDGVYDDRDGNPRRACAGRAVTGSIDDLIRDYRQSMVDSIIVALPLSSGERVDAVLERLRVIPADIRLCADSYGLNHECHGISRTCGLTLLNLSDKPLAGRQALVKSIFDRVFAAAVLVLLAPVLVFVALAIKLDSPGPVLFRQKRHGYNNRLFEVVKFRTLYHHARDANADRLSGDDDPRVTRVGRYLRRTMIDELPQFLNVLRGEMSVVGPRPHALGAKADGRLYRDVVQDYDARHRMKPGVTGWAQVNGWRGETKTLEQIEQRVAHDLYYIDNWSMGFDLRIIAATAWMLVRAVPSKMSEEQRHAISMADAGRSGPAA